MCTIMLNLFRFAFSLNTKPLHDFLLFKAMKPYVSWMVISTTKTTTLIIPYQDCPGSAAWEPVRSPDPLPH